MNSNPLNAVLHTIKEQPGQPDAMVEYRSRGRLLIIGTAEKIIEAARSLSTLELNALVIESCTQRQLDDLKKIVRLAGAGPVFELDGYLGNFELQSGEATQKFDLILDLRPKPWFSQQILPLGYYSVAKFPGGLEAILNELPDMVGDFDKPKFFELVEQKCAHSSSQLDGCRQCIDVCATRAIASVGHKITVNPYLCQGCGDCSTVCPSGAINYRYPSRHETLIRLKEIAAAFIEMDGTCPVLLLHDGELNEVALTKSDRVIPYRLEALGSAGMDIWLCALAFGYRSVFLFEHDGITEKTRQALNAQMQICRTILQGMGYSAGLLQWHSEDVTLTEFEEINHIAPATFVLNDDKRDMIRAAVEHLYRFAEEKTPMVSLPNGAPFGDIKVDGSHCTLCLSCVSVCPNGALLAGRDQPLLKFIESDCVQCGLCGNACPEKIITMIPRYSYDSKQARQTRVLHEETVFHCIRCQKPFATERMIKVISGKLQHHPMFQGKNAERLQMCDECRVKAQFDFK